jgi:hypothetical protein
MKSWENDLDVHVGNLPTDINRISIVTKARQFAIRKIGISKAV